MKTFTVEGNGWKVDVEIDESNYDKYKDMTSEAMARAIAMFLHNDSETGESLGFIMLAYEKGSENDPNKKVACMTTHVLRNAGYYALAEEAEESLKHMMGKK